MKIIISPAKSLNVETAPPPVEFSQAVFLTEAVKINALLKKKSAKVLSKLMGISDTLAELNWERNQNFTAAHTTANSRPAIYTFDGDVYNGLDAYTISNEGTVQMQKNLRILSGLYGLLKPLDLIQPYRLEMGTSFKVGTKKDLYEFWKTKVTPQLQEELQEDEVVVNLASKEYANAIDFKVLKAKVVSPQFKDFKNGTLKIISFFAKKARGMLARHLLDVNGTGLEDVLSFSTDGYRFSEAETKNPLQPVFVR